MLSRIDGINNYIMFSDRINLWQNTKIIQEPLYPWEFVQIGNAGSPLETEKGWLVITHGVGPMRTYSLGVTLLDLEDPTRVIARCREPLLFADEDEREGNVPNVIYACGSLIHNGEIVLPYAMSDESSTYATIPLESLLAKLIPQKDRPKAEARSDYRASLLIVDDDEMLLESMEETLTREGFRTRTASDGIDALMLIARESFDIVLSDINMPNLDGFQLLKQMKQRGIDIPVIFMTGHEEKYFELRGKELGAVEYIKKPIEHKKLKEMLDNLLL
jgi:CheY-like chemotaxis protein